MGSRFTIEKGHIRAKPWMVIDNTSDPAEDAVLYFFSSRSKAETFIAMLMSELQPANDSTVVA